MNKWLVIATRPRWEKKVHHSLKEKGIECYCPLNRVYRRWSDRIKMVEEPLFKSYVFVKITDNDRPVVRMTNGVVNFVYAKGRPAILKEKQIQSIRKFIDAYQNIEVLKFDAENTDTVAETATGAAAFDPKKSLAKIQINGCYYILSANTEQAKTTDNP